MVYKISECNVYHNTIIYSASELFLISTKIQTHNQSLQFFFLKISTGISKEDIHFNFGISLIPFLKNETKISN